MEMTMSTEEISVKQAAELLGLNEQTVYGYVRSGKIAARRIGRGRWRIARADVAPKPAVVEATPDK